MASKKEIRKLLQWAKARKKALEAEEERGEVGQALIDDTLEELRRRVAGPMPDMLSRIPRTRRDNQN